MLSLSTQDYAGPVGPVGMLCPFIQDYAGMEGPNGTLSPSIQDGIGPVGPVGTLPPSTQDSVGLVGLLGTLPPFTPSIGVPVLGRFNANGSGRDSRNVVEMETAGYEYLTAPAGGDGCAVVAMVGFHTDRTLEEAPMNCISNGPEWDIRNEFETVDGMPVYYGGDLCVSDDSEDSEWEDPWKLAYAEHVERYNLDVIE